MAAKEYTYTVIFEPVEAGGYQVVVPALPEIMSFGRTLDEARKMAEDAIRCALEGLTKEGQALPMDTAKQPRTEKVRVTLQVA
ncbi:MAG: type II toxin-antitoxin system HicB family antitoxin [candidate division NC10 bacterium]|nr:type II toxin-antitoxin system HicB family antitoxin [candidate division NC10 bacterium]MCZ6551441.1 type II toxin-antitoxin system HicB family antitoxin [candidate division NC10 bacterium]